MDLKLGTMQRKRYVNGKPCKIRRNTITLTRNINGNPTMTLQKIASA